ncbi:MAG: single-stranded-DNA-specific exonuclease RecJ [Dokdonella sp.]|uniref:single-stranded-DNA-specific exonuclease RecJ n=1 Tax=Dokdonella sp. TaxID=2291710 RepID=UPI002B6A3411|nr:single-stranded-DNA-specific exonuclease RecJ [Dokdonella sp.]HPN79488.1 single-stranded-DNA-specific exonuclease RecJ [Dokdonella sp.]
MHPVLQRVLAARGVGSPGEIDHRLANMAAPATLGGIDTACVLLADAIERGRRIFVVGDFDCDGATGTAVAVRGLRMLGAAHVDFRVPNRAVHGYGLSTALVDTLHDPAPDLIVTVDNGVASLAGVAAARARGIDVLITDHHLPGPDLPIANAIVNPNLDGDAFPSKALAGVGVMFCLLVALRGHLRTQGFFASAGLAEPDLGVLLDLVAVGTVADLVPLDFNNRILVEAGMRRIREQRACAGVLALLRAAGRDPAMLVSSDLGFAVAPRINAAGRLEDMGLGIACLLTDDAARAAELAERLSAINAERRELQAQMIEQAEAFVARWIAMQGQAALPRGLTLFDEAWHPGVVGLVAARLKERLHRPVVACAPAGEGTDEIRASARSIRGIHIRDVLTEVDANHPGLIERFGGHAMAAGLTLRRASLDGFSAAFDSVIRTRAAAELFDPVVWTDGELEPTDFCLELASLLRFAMPWGQSFDEPLFDNVFALDSWRVVGNAHWRLGLRLAGLERPIEAMLFNADAGARPPDRLRAVYQLDINDWNGRESLRLILRHIMPA